MATDYDEPRVRPEDQPANESLEAIQAHRSTTTQTSVIDVEDSDTAEGLDLPGAILEEELLVQVIRSRKMSSPACPAFWSTTAASSRAKRTATSTAPSARDDSRPASSPLMTA